MQKTNFNIDEYVDNFEKIIIFKTCTSIKNIYKSIENYLNSIKVLSKPFHTLTDEEIHSLNKFNKTFQINKTQIEKIITKPRIDGIRTRITKHVLNKVKERGIIKVFNHGAIVYKNKLPIRTCSSYVVDIKVLKSYFNDENVFNTKSDFYTKKQHKIIDKFILNYKKEPIIMNTKKSKKSQKIKTTKIQPNNDIPTEDIFEDQLIPRLQEFIDKKYISLKFAKTFLQRINKSFNHLHEANGGTCTEDLFTQISKTARKNIVGYIIKNYKEQLEEDDYKVYIETYKQLAN